MANKDRLKKPLKHNGRNEGAHGNTDQSVATNQSQAYHKIADSLGGKEQRQQLHFSCTEKHLITDSLSERRPWSAASKI